MLSRTRLQLSVYSKSKLSNIMKVLGRGSVSLECQLSPPSHQQPGKQQQFSRKDPDFTVKVLWEPNQTLCPGLKRELASVTDSKRSEDSLISAALMLATTKAPKFSRMIDTPLPSADNHHERASSSSSAPSNERSSPSLGKSQNFSFGATNSSSSGGGFGRGRGFGASNEVDADDAGPVFGSQAGPEAGKNLFELTPFGLSPTPGGIEAAAVSHINSQMKVNRKLQGNLKWHLGNCSKYDKIEVCIVSAKAEANAASGETGKSGELVVAQATGGLFAAYRLALERYCEVLKSETGSTTVAFKFDQRVRAIVPPQDDQLPLWQDFVDKLLRQSFGKEVPPRLSSQTTPNANGLFTTQYYYEPVKGTACGSSSSSGIPAGKIPIGYGSSKNSTASSIEALKDVVKQNFPVQYSEILINELKKDIGTTTIKSAAVASPTARSPPAAETSAFDESTVLDAVHQWQLRIDAQNAKVIKAEALEREEETSVTSLCESLLDSMTNSVYKATVSIEHRTDKNGKNRQLVFVTKQPKLQSLLENLTLASDSPRSDLPVRLQLYRDALRVLGGDSEENHHLFSNHVLNSSDGYEAQFTKYFRAMFATPLDNLQLRTEDRVGVYSTFAVCLTSLSGDAVVLGEARSRTEDGARSDAFQAALQAVTGSNDTKPLAGLGSRCTIKMAVPDPWLSLLRVENCGDVQNQEVPIDYRVEGLVKELCGLWAVHVWSAAFSDGAATLWKVQLIGTRKQEVGKVEPAVAVARGHNPFIALWEAQQELCGTANSTALSMVEAARGDMFTSSPIQHQSHWTPVNVCEEVLKKAHGAELSITLSDVEDGFLAVATCQFGAYEFELGRFAARSKKAAKNEVALSILRSRPEYQTLTTFTIPAPQLADAVGDSAEGTGSDSSAKGKASPSPPKAVRTQSLEQILKNAMKRHRTKPNELRVESGRVSGGHFVRLYAVPYKTSRSKAKGAPVKMTLDLLGEKQIAFEKHPEREKALSQACYKVLQESHLDALSEAVSEDPDLLDGLL